MHVVGFDRRSTIIVGFSAEMAVHIVSTVWECEVVAFAFDVAG